MRTWPGGGAGVNAGGQAVEGVPECSEPPMPPVRQKRERKSVHGSLPQRGEGGWGPSRSALPGGPHPEVSLVVSSTDVVLGPSLPLLVGVYSQPPASLGHPPSDTSGTRAARLISDPLPLLTRRMAFEPQAPRQAPSARGSGAPRLSAGRAALTEDQRPCLGQVATPHSRGPGGGHRGGRGLCPLTPTRWL